MLEALYQRKQAIRSAVRAQRAERTLTELSNARSSLTGHLIDLVTAQGAQSVSCYMPIAGEPDTSEFIEWALSHQIEVLLPSARADGLLNWVRASNAGTSPGAFGIPEPVGERLGPLSVSDVDLMLIPACAVDLQGVRLGWGRGYFDRNLGEMRLRPQVFAVVYENEIFDYLPSETHDIPVSGAVTPAGRRCFKDARTPY